MQTKPTIKARAWSGRVVIEAKETRTYLSFDDAIDFMDAIDKALCQAAIDEQNEGQ